MTKAIILDCRLLKEFETKRITNSIHIACHDKITKKRLLSNRLSVRDLISCEEIREKLESTNGKCDENKISCYKMCDDDEAILIVFYDESTNDEFDLNQSPLQIVFDNARSTLANVNCKILKGKNDLLIQFLS